MDLTVELQKVQAAIEKTSADIEALKARLDALPADAPASKADDLRQEIVAKREEKAALRREKELLLQRLPIQGESTSASVETAVRKVFDERDKQRAGTPKPKGYSRASSGDANALLEELNLIEVDGNVMDPIEVPDGQPFSAAFDYERYPDEDAGTPAFIKHHQKQLEAFGVKFGRGGFGAYDLHSERSLYAIASASGRAFDGTVDGCIAPYGLLKSSAGRNSVVLYEHKQSNDQKQAYADAHPEMPERPEAVSTGTVKYKAHRPQSITAMLGAYAYNEFPLIIDLSDGVVHHLLQIHGDALYVWQNLTPQQAYYKQADVLKSLAGLLSDKKLRLTLQDIPEDMQAPVKRARAALRHDARLRDQLDSVVSEAPPSERLACAHEVIASWLQSLPEAVPTSVMHMYG